MSRKIEGRTSIFLNGQQADQELKKLSKQVDILNKKLQEQKKANDLSGWKKTRKELSEVRKQERLIKKQTVEVTDVLKRLNKTNLNELLMAQKKLNHEIKYVNQGTKEYLQKSKQLNLVSARINKINNSLRVNKSFLNRAASAFNKFSMMAISAIAALTGFILKMKNSVNISNEFYSKLSYLSAITGLTGEKLKWLAKEAQIMSGSIIESNIRITKSADDILEAYAVVGSKRPELLKNKKALNDVTKESLILAEASKLDLASSVNALTTVMNQFNKSASQSRKIINILGAGSLYGSAMIPYLTTALEKCGATANLFHMSMEETVGVIEAIAPKFAEARVAGRNFDRFLLTLQKKNIGFKNGVFNLNDALIELKARFSQGENAMDIFGKRQAKLAIVLTQAQKQYNEFTKKVTNSNIAVHQAGINTDNNKAKLDQARNRLHNLTVELGNELAPAIHFSTSSTSYFVKILVKAIRFFKEYRKIIILTTISIATYTIATKIAVKWNKIHSALLVTKNFLLKAITITWLILTGRIKLATRALKIWIATSKFSGIGLIITAIAALSTGIIYLIKNTNKAATAQKKFNEEQKKAAEIKKKLLDTSENLITQIKSETSTLYEQIEAYKELQKLHPDTFKGMSFYDFQNMPENKAKDKIKEDIQKEEEIKLNDKIIIQKKKISKIEKLLIENQQIKNKYKDEIYKKDLKRLEKTKDYLKLLIKESDRRKEIQKEVEYNKLSGAKKYQNSLDSYNLLLNQKKELEKTINTEDQLTLIHKVHLLQLADINKDLKKQNDIVDDNYDAHKAHLQQLAEEQKIRDKKVYDYKKEYDLLTDKEIYEYEKQIFLDKNKDENNYFLKYSEQVIGLYYLKRKYLKLNEQDQIITLNIELTNLKSKYKKDLISYSAYIEAKKKLNLELAKAEHNVFDSLNKPEDWLKNVDKKKKEKKPDNFELEDEENIDDETTYLTDKWAKTYEGRLTLLEAYHNAELISDAEFNDKKIELEEEKNKEILETEKELQKDLKQLKTDFVNQSINVALNLMQSASQAQYDFDIHKSEEKYEKDLKSLEDKHKKGLISDKRYNQLKDKLDKKKAKDELKIKIKQAKQEKEIASLSIGVDSAMSIFKILAKASVYAADPLTAPLAALAYKQIPIILAGAAIQLAAIEAEPLPQFKKGKYNVKGIDDNKIYNAEYYKNPKTGLLNKPAILAGELPEIIIDPETTKNLQINYPEVIDAINFARVPQYINGNFQNINTTSNKPYEINTFDPELKTFLIKNLQMLENLDKKDFKAYLIANEDYIRTHNETQDQYNNFLKDISS